MAKTWKRSERLRYAANDLGDIARELDKLQVGDYNNEISPLKHELLEVQHKLLRLAQKAADEEYEQGKK